MRDFRVQCLVVFVLSLIADIVGALHIRTLVSSEISLAVLTIVALQFLNFWSQAAFIDHKELSKRLWITASVALGCGVGTAIIMLVY